MTPAQRLVYAHLIDHVDANRHAWPSVATLAVLTGCHKDTVRRALSHLAALGLIFSDGSMPSRQGSPVTRWLIPEVPSLAGSDPSPSREGSQEATLRVLKGSQDAGLGVSKGRSERPEVDLKTFSSREGSSTSGSQEATLSEEPLAEDTRPKKIVCNCCGDKYRPGEEHANQQNIGWVCQPVASDRWKTRERYQRRTARR